MLNISNTLALLRNLAFQRQNAARNTWRELSWKFGGILPHSLLMVTIQKDGEVDLILRCIEDDAAAVIRNKGQEGLEEFDADFSATVVRYWIGSMYETFRVLKNKIKENSNPLVHEIYDDLRLIRIPLEKHEIASDGELKEPLKLAPTGEAPDEATVYVYDKKDPFRSHIMPGGICTFCGSHFWIPVDGRTQKQRQIMRRTISDKILFLKEISPTSP
jgi:hypothetical protein